MKLSTKPFKIALACDHRGFFLKEKIKKYLEKKGHPTLDFGTDSEVSVDYPDYILKAAESVSDGKTARAIGICYTGIGSSIIANKVKGVRASLVKSVREAKLTRAHNNSNMLILGSGFLKKQNIIAILEAWLKTPFEGGRHERRVHKISNYEKKHL
ncbi:MAG: ribose 5-phosphate isomerase B [Candidatus Omnitrophica bacterium]|nr:ribose 5-phosphate isomerase B [Candidatus Omnitrophota bacterium]